MKTSTTRRRVSLAAVLAALALTFTACGADGGDDVKSTTTTTTASNDDGMTTTTASNDDGMTTTTQSDGGTTTAPDGPSTSGNISGMAKDLLVDAYKKMGMTQKQAKCAADFVVDKMGDVNGLDDMSGLAELGKDMFKKCDIDPTDLKPKGN
jgi:hypothetical protein